MRIGIDIDGVILDSEKQFRNAAELYDILELKRNSIINVNEGLIQRKYDWTDAEFHSFADKYFAECSKRSNLMPGAKEVIELLKKDGHELIIITARGYDLSIMKDIVEEIIKREGLQFDKYYWRTPEKVGVARSENIDIMIEDSLHNCEKFADEGIRTIYLRDSNMKPSNNHLIKECYLWAEIYRYIIGLEK